MDKFVQSHASCGEGEGGVVDRRFRFCPPMIEKYSPADLFVECRKCGTFFARCCQHEHTGKACHHFRLIFTDGACAGNGKDGAAAGGPLFFFHEMGEL